MIVNGYRIEPEAHLNWAELSGANLSGANLSWANLSGTNLSWANLSGANLNGANLSWANLSGTNLSWVNLSGANLNGANLNGADLNGANLNWAHLSGADLSGADLSGANLNGTDLSWTNLSWTNLSGTCLDPEAPLPSISDAELSTGGLICLNGWVYGWRTQNSPVMGGGRVYQSGVTYCSRLSRDANMSCHPGIYLVGTKKRTVDMVPVRCRRERLVHGGGKWRASPVQVLYEMPREVLDQMGEP